MSTGGNGGHDDRRPIGWLAALRSLVQGFARAVWGLLRIAFRLAWACGAAFVLSIYFDIDVADIDVSDALLHIGVLAFAVAPLFSSWLRQSAPGLYVLYTVFLCCLLFPAGMQWSWRQFWQENVVKPLSCLTQRSQPSQQNVDSSRSNGSAHSRLSRTDAVLNKLREEHERRRGQH